MSRVLVLGGLAWLAVVGLFVWGLGVARAPRVGPNRPSAAAVHAEGGEPRTGDEWWTWRVTRAMSAERVMVVDVEARNVEEARAIAAQIVEPVRTHGYEEVLVYVRKPFAGDGPVERRVQWTPAGGFVELIYSTTP